MKRLVLLAVICAMLLSGCGIMTQESGESHAPPVSASETEVSSFGSEDDGFLLTYPASFTLTDSGKDYYEFKDEDKDLSIKLSIAENRFSGLSAQEYPEAMDVDMYSKMLSSNSFDRDIYVKDDSSYYYIYTLTDDNIYCLEYAYNGEENEDDLIDLLNLEVYDEFSGSDNTETLKSYAAAYLEDYRGPGDYTLVPQGTIVISGGEFASFTAYSSVDAICLIAVNDDGVCYVDTSLKGTDYQNIEDLLYEAEPVAGDPLIQSAAEYYQSITGTKPASESIALYEPDFTFEGFSLRVYSVTEGGTVILIGITPEGAGYADRTGSGTAFEIIEK